MTCPTKKLGEVCDVIIGGTPRREVSEYWDGGTLPWVSIADLSRGGQEITETKEKITELGAKESNVKLLKRGTLLFSFKLSIGKLAFAGGDLFTNEAIAGLRIKDGQELDKKYLFYFLQQLDFDTAHKAVKGATLNKEKIKNLKIPLLPIGEQRRMVERIEKQFKKIDEAARLRAANEERAAAFLPAALHEIFSLSAWEERELGDLFDITSSKRVFQSEWRESGVPFYRARELVSLASGKPFRSPIFIGEEMYELYKEKYGAPKEGDILATGVGTLGVTYRVREGDKFYFKDGNIIWFKKKSDVLSEFIGYFFQSRYLKNQIDANAGGATVKTFTIKNANKIKVPLPPLAEQKEIVKKLDALSAKVKSLQELQRQQSADLKELKQSILHEAFT